MAFWGTVTNKSDNSEEEKKRKKLLEQAIQEQKIAKQQENEELNNLTKDITFTSSTVPISTRNKDADNGNFFGGLLGGLLPGSSIADLAIKKIREDQTLQQEAKKKGIDLNNLYTTQENANMFGADLGRTVEATGAGISSALSNLGKGTLIAARNMGVLNSAVDKAITDLRAGTENDQIEKLKSKAKEKGIDTVTLDEYLDKAKNTKTSLELINDFSANTFDKWSNEANQRIAELQGETDNDFTKAVIGFVPNISQQAVTIGASLINPVLGTSVATGQAMGSYYNDAKSRGMTDEQANDFSQIMGIVEGATEMISVDKLVKAGKGAKALAKGGLKSARKELSKEVITSTFGNLLGSARDNFIQEAITEPIQEGVADWIGGKGNWENIDERMLKAGIDGAITSLITGGANIGVQSAVGIASKTRNGQTATQQEVNQGLVDTLAEIDKLSKEEKQEFIDKYVTPGIQTAQDVVKNEQNQVPTEPNRAVPMQTSENAQQQVQKQEQQVISNQNENALKSNVEPQNLVESAERSGIDVKDEKTRKNLETIQKFNENRGVKATFDADAFKGHDNVNSFFRTDENGNREIVFNPNTMTDKTIEQLAVHEVYHDMVAGGTAQELTDFVIQKMSNNPEYQDYVKALQDVYEEQDSDIIKEEAVAHYLEKNLGTNEFISELQERGDRTTIQRIIDTIKDMITKAKNTLTGKGDLNYLLDLQRKYEQAYNGEFKGSQEQTKLSKQVNTQDNQGKTLTKEQPINKITDDNKLKMTYVRMNNQDTQNYGDTYGQNIEPSGEYMSMDTMQGKYKVPGAEYGTITFENPLVLEHKNTTANGWKKDLSERYNNLTGKKLSNAIMKDGYDAIVTQDEKGNVIEVVNLNGNKETNNNNTKYSVNTSNQPTTDNQGRTLTKEQQDYFKDSKVRDENGNLETFYHGANKQFNTFNSTRKPIYGNKNVNFFTNNENVAKSYGGEVYETYINSKSPYILNGDTNGTTLEYSKTGKEELTQNSDIIKAIRQKLDENVSRYYKKSVSKISENILDNNKNILSNEEIQYLTEHPLSLAYLSVKAKDGFVPYSKSVNTNDLVNAVLSINEKTNNKYDGVIFKSIQDAGQNFDNNAFTKNDVIATFEPNQIKNVDNTNPTESPDIRYSKEAPTKDNQGRELSKGQQERLKNTKAVDKDGDVLELYHFTPSGDFTIFDKTRANPESDMGAGFYFTNSKIDGQQNYQDENGADIRNRIDRLAEQIESEEDITYEEAREKAEQQVLQGGSSFNVYLDIENPAYIGGENETRLFTQEDIRKYAEENDLGYDFENEEDAYDNALADYVENITNDLYDTYSFDEVQQIQRAIYDAIYENDFEGINVQQLKDKLNDPDNFIEIYDDNGNLVTNEIARQIVENIGYDGIIDNTVSSKFNMNLDPDTTHYIVFRPEQIKNVTNLNPTDNPDINLSKQGTGTSQEAINNFLENTKVNEGTGTKIKDLARVPIQQETQVETKTKEAPVSQVTTQDYLTHHPDYYDGDQFDFNAHRTEVINKANQDIVDIIKNSNNLREDLQRAYDLNEKNDVVDIKTGQDEDNRLTYQQKETILSSLLRSKDIENSDLYKSLMEDTTPRQVAPNEAPVSQETTQNNTKNNEILKTARQLLDKQYALQLSDEMANLSETELKSGLQDLYKLQLDEQLYNAIKDDTKSKRTYMKYKDKDTNYVKSVVEDALYSEKPNRNGKLTVKQWLNIANQIGINASDLTTQQIQDLAYGSWFDLKPTKRITQYDNKIHQAVPFEALTADKWVNAIYNKAKDLKIQDFNQLLNEVQEPIKSNITETTEPVRQVAPSEAPAQVPQVNEVKQRQVENTQPTTQETITQQTEPVVSGEKGQRKTLGKEAQNQNLPQEFRDVADKLYKTNLYTKKKNSQLKTQAQDRISKVGADNLLTDLTEKTNNSPRLSAEDMVASIELYNHYVQKGDIQKSETALQNLAMSGTEIAQALQAMSIMNHLTPQGQAIWIQRSADKLNKSMLAKKKATLKTIDGQQRVIDKNGKDITDKTPLFKFTQEMQKKLLNSTKDNMYDVIDDIYKEMGQQVPKTHMEQFDEWRFFSMLGNPKTHIRNSAGNVTMEGLRQFKNKLAGAIEDAYYSVTGKDGERNHTLRFADKKTKEFAKQDVKNRDVQTMLGVTEDKYNPQSRLKQNQRTFKSNLLEKSLGKVFKGNTGLLSKEDVNLFGIAGLEPAYRRSLTEYITANRLDVDTMTDKQLQRAREYAVTEAKEATFHTYNKIASMLNTLENKNLATKILVGGTVPFKQTPMNVAIQGFEYSPAGLLKTLTYDTVQLKNGNINANQYINKISKGLTGTGIALLGYALTSAGILKASSGGDDKDDYEKSLGKQNYAIQIGDNTYSLDWLAPAGIPLFVGSELYQISKADAEEKKGGNVNQNEIAQSAENLFNAMTTAMNPMTEMTMLSGLTSVLKSYANDPAQALGNIIINTGKSYATQSVPTALGQIVRSADDKERSTTSTESNVFTKALDTTKNQIMSKLPGLRQMLPVATDVWGNEIEGKNYIENAILPANRKEVKTDKVDEAITKLYDETGESAVIPDTYIQKTLTLDKEKYRLTNEEYAQLKQQYGQSSHDLLEALTSSSDYDKLTNEQKVKAVKEVYSYVKASLKHTYADQNDIDAEDSKVYQKVQDVIRNGGDAKDYFKYVGLTNGMDKDAEKINALENSNIRNKGAIYESTIGKDDDDYKIMKNTGVNDKAYLDYKQQKFTADKDAYGKTISGSAKNKFYDYMDNANMTYEQKLLLTGMNYTLLPGERDTLANYIESLPISASEKTDIYRHLKGAKVYNNGEIYY